MTRRPAARVPAPRRGTDRSRKRPPGGDGLGGGQVEGRHAVLELLVTRRRPVRRLLVAARGHDAELAAAAAAAGVAVEKVSDEEIARQAATAVPQGVVALADEVFPRTLAELAAARAGEPVPFLVVLDHVTDPHNLGAVLRSAAGAGATGVVLARQRAAHLSPAAVKAAAGAVEHLDFALVAGIPAALSMLGSAGLWSVALDAGAALDIDEVTVLSDPVALVLGAEGRGLAPLVAARCDVRCAIPLPGPVESLNVSAAAAVACFTVARHRRAGAVTRERPAARRRAAVPKSPLA